jgi:hypothetical protein
MINPLKRIISICSKKLSLTIWVNLTYFDHKKTHSRREESSPHVTRCMDPGQSEMIAESSDLFLDWLHETHMDADLVNCIATYLQSRSTSSMRDIASSFPQYSTIAADIDALGWDCFLEGRIPQKCILRQCESFLKIRTWSSNCVQYLLNITHRQWLYRNARIYLKSLMA